MTLLSLPPRVKNQSFAYQRLQVVLGYWEQDKHQKSYCYLSICARKQGQKIQSIWVDAQVDAYSVIEKAFSRMVSEATSFEAEFLYGPQSRQINLFEKKQWNSLRGKRAAFIHYQGHTTRWSSLVMLAKNLSFQRIANQHLAQVANREKMDQGKHHENKPKRVPVTLYKTQQYHCSNTRGQGAPTAQQPLPTPMFRGNQAVKLEMISRQSLRITQKAMTYWLASQVNEKGQAEYKYWPSRGEFASSNNAIRQWMATVCLNRAALAFNDPALQAVAANNLAFNMQTTFQSEGSLGYIFMNGSAKLGSASLAALAILESPQRQQYLSQEYALNQLIEHLSNQDGSFDTFYIPRKRKDNQNFYSGEALLFLASRYVISRNPDELERFMAGFHYYQNWHLNNRNPAFVPWHTQACYLIWEVTKEAALKDFIFEMNDWLLSMQQWESAEFADMQGRFYDPERAYYGPPHASSTGVYLEGLIDAFTLAKQCGDNQRVERYRVAIVRGIRSIIQLQYKNEIDCFYIKNTAKVLGGIRTTVYDNTIRIDNVQHALMAFFKIYARFSDVDYQLPATGESKDKHDSTNTARAYKHFRKIDFPIPLEEIRDEIAVNNALWLANTSRQDSLKVQRETQTIFLRSARKPYPPGVSGNDIHESCETKYAVCFPIIMETLQRFADKVNGGLSRVTVVRLQPESKVYPHIDEGEYYKYRDRYHIVVQSPTGSEMIAGEEKMLWQEGEFWWFANKTMHEAYNKGNEYRVHIIFDVLPDCMKAVVKPLTDQINKEAVS